MDFHEAKRRLFRDVAGSEIGVGVKTGLIGVRGGGVDLVNDAARRVYGGRFSCNGEGETRLELFLAGVAENAQLVSDLFHAAGPRAGSADGGGS